MSVVEFPIICHGAAEAENSSFRLSAKVYDWSVFNTVTIIAPPHRQTALYVFVWIIDGPDVAILPDERDYGFQPTDSRFVAFSLAFSAGLEEFQVNAKVQGNLLLHLMWNLTQQHIHFCVGDVRCSISWFPCMTKRCSLFTLIPPLVQPSLELPKIHWIEG